MSHIFARVPTRRIVLTASIALIFIACIVPARAALVWPTQFEPNNGSQGSIRTVGEDGSSPQMLLGYPDVFQPGGMAVSADKMYFSSTDANLGGQSIYSANFDGTGLVEVVPGRPITGFMEYDSSSNSLFYGGSLGVLYRYDLGSNTESTVFDAGAANSIRGIALHGSDLYVAVDEFHSFRVEKGTAADFGGTRSTLINQSGGGAQGLDVADTGDVYIARLGDHSLLRYDSNGDWIAGYTGWENNNLVNPYSVLVIDQTLYVGVDGEGKGGIWKTDLAAGNRTEIYNFGFPSGLTDLEQVPVPEPGGIALLLCGLAGLIFLKRRR